MYRHSSTRTFRAEKAKESTSINQAAGRMRRRARPSERTRPSVANLNKAFDLLRSYVPTYSSGKKLTKIETLRLAINYIKDMTQLLQEAELRNIEKCRDWEYLQPTLSTLMSSNRAGKCEVCGRGTQVHQLPTIHKKIDRERHTFPSSHSHSQTFTREVPFHPEDPKSLFDFDLADLSTCADRDSIWPTVGEAVSSDPSPSGISNTSASTIASIQPTPQLFQKERISSSSALLSSSRPTKFSFCHDGNFQQSPSFALTCTTAFTS